MRNSIIALLIVSCTPSPYNDDWIEEKLIIMQNEINELKQQGADTIIVSTYDTVFSFTSSVDTLFIFEEDEYVKNSPMKFVRIYGEDGVRYSLGTLEELSPVSQNYQGQIDSLEAEVTARDRIITSQDKAIDVMRYNMEQCNEGFDSMVRNHSNIYLNDPDRYYEIRLDEEGNPYVIDYEK